MFTSYNGRLLLVEDTVKIYFNPNCSKCRSAVDQLNEKGTTYGLIRYLDDHPTTSELRELIDVLQDPLDELVRKDQNFRHLGLRADDYRTIESVVALLTEHPELMQRPVIVKNGKATIARTPDKVNELA